MSETLEQKLCKRSRGYFFIRNFLVRPAIYLFYRKIDVIGAKDVPDEGPVIFTPNHQNALMDALSVLCTKDRQPVFVARADIFQKPLIRSILHFLRILPIYRKRDGGISSDNNKETFDLILKVLDSRHAVGIMPEGTHNQFKRLQMLQKGVFRMAMQVQEKHGAAPTVKIIPVGLEYTCNSKFRSGLTVRYGKAIELSDFYDTYVENSAKAYKQMQDVLMEKMREGMIDITDELYYSEIERLRVLYQKRATQKLGLDFRNAEHRLQAQQKTVAVLQDYAKSNSGEMSSFCGTVRDYLTILQKHNLRDWVIERQPYYPAGLAGRCILAIGGLPLWLLGMLFNYLPYRMSAFASRKIKDPQFVSSVQFVAGLVLYPLYYIIVIVLTAIFIPCIWGKLLMPLLIIPSGLFAFKYYISMKKLGARFRFRLNRKELHKAVELRKTVFDKMDGIF